MKTVSVHSLEDGVGFKKPHKLVNCQNRYITINQVIGPKERTKLVRNQLPFMHYLLPSELCDVPETGDE